MLDPAAENLFVGTKSNMVALYREYGCQNYFSNNVC